MLGRDDSADMDYAGRWTVEVMIVNKSNSVDFAQFFQALWGNPPFAWQQELADRVSGNADRLTAWPEAIALPTAAGKTACVDIAIFALAKQASRLDRGEIITAPRRIFFVVDRRVIVDQAYERAREIAKKLRHAENGVLRIVADSLRQIAFGATSGYDREIPLRAYALRGGMFRSEAWARDPLQPIVVASTVDQVGSRLLFRAYGRGSGAWPVYAALIANDSLILLDEAHCAQPFLQTLRAVDRFREWAYTPLGRSFHPVVMSATPPDLRDVFKDTSEERNDPDHRLGQRQLAQKLATLKKVSKAKGQQATGELTKSMAKAALYLVSDQLRAIVVFVNRVATARATYKLLKEKKDIDVVVLTGRMRPVDKDWVVDQYLKNLQSDCSEGRELERPMIVVATQTLEVGADLDFDGLVTECASLDALRQRFGRLNRLGRDIESRAVILVREDQATLKKGDEGDPVYGAALTKTWDWLNENKDTNGEVDFGIAYLDQKLPTGDSMEALNAPSSDAPVMLPAHVDCWAQTAPEPRPSPDVALFLHGPQEGVADVQVCWRADIDLAEGKADALEVLRLCPPSSVETLPVPIGVFRRWLSGEQADDDSSDVEGTERDIDQSDEGSPNKEHNIVRWRGISDTQVNDITANPRDVRPGDVIVVPTSHPGRYDQIGDFPSNSNGAVDLLDIGDRAHMTARAKPILRLHRKLVEAWPSEVAAAKEETRELLKEINENEKHEHEPDEVVDTLDRILVDLSTKPLPENWSWLSETAGWLAEEFSGTKLRQAYHIIGDNQIIIVGNRKIDRLIGDADTFSDEDDTSASGISHSNRHPVRLESHLRGVESFARRYAKGCGLSDDLIEAVARAGLLHDVGKADPRFQAWLRGGNRWWKGQLLAKSGQMPKGRAVARARKAAGYPRGSRHELLSVRLAESNRNLLPQDLDLQDLTLHLIASHHGHCRPFAPVVSDETGADTKYCYAGEPMQWSGPTCLERLDSGIADRYWRLARRYGWWGLAWLEALLRLADWRRSEWEETHDDSE